MKLNALVLAVALVATPLAGCANLSAIVGGGSLAAPQSMADAEKALALAHLAYQGAGIALKDAAASGALHGADAATAKTLYDRVGAVLDAADAADALADASGVLAAVADANTLVAQIGALIPKK
ncbi:MAG TPA: hypothetical protein VJ476_09140 [Rhizomicrobium sp.]|nr:hypothetical protein [Rhizomicrobium sp.]